MKKNTVTKKHIDDLISRAEVTVSTAHDKVTIVSLKLPNGFVITESSACVDPANYDEKVGRDICMERITNKLWELEGYLLANKLAGGQPAHYINVRTTTEVKTSWEDIAAAAQEGTLADLLKSGDYIPLTLKNGDEVGLDVGRDESGRTYFIFHNAMSERHCMNKELTNKGGWRDSEMRRYANEEVFDLLPDEVKAIIKPTKIVQVLNGERIETNDNLFCLSATQIYGDIEYWRGQEPEDTQIDIFRDPHNRIKIRAGASSASWWWSRSALGTSLFILTGTDGSVNNDASYTGYAVPLGFCIENQ